MQDSECAIECLIQGRQWEEALRLVSPLYILFLVDAEV